MITILVSVQHYRKPQAETINSLLPATIGRSSSADIRLKSWRLAAEHCLLEWDNQQLWIQPIKDAVCVINNALLQAPRILSRQDVLTLGPFSLTFDWVDTTPTQQPGELAPQLHPVNLPKVLPDRPEGAGDQSFRLTWQIAYRQALLAAFDLKRNDIDQLDDNALRQTACQQLADLIDTQADLPQAIDKRQFINEVVAEVVGLGAIEPLLANPSVTEIMVNGPDSIFYELGGVLSQSPIRYSNSHALMATIERIVQPMGRRIDESSPMVDARLKDGSRVNAIIPPLALNGPSLTIRKFSQERLTMDDLIHFDAASKSMGAFLSDIVHHKSNIIISGGTGSGKTTLLNILSAFIPDHERVITIEDAAELKLNQPNMVSLESRPTNAEGKGQVSIRDLVRNSLRMRPDRIVIGECRGGEALDMLQAMNTGHAGSLSTIHSNSPRDCLSRLEIMVMMAGMDIPVRAIREQLASAIDFVVQQTRFPCGQRKITSITEVGGLEQGIIQLTEVFAYRATGFNSEGQVSGHFSATGIIPDFVENQRRQGMTTDTSLFSGDAL